MKNDDLEEKTHELFEPLRRQIVQVSKDFGRRVADGIEAFLANRDRTPSMFDVFGGILVESINIATDRRDGDEDEAEENDDD